MRVFVVEPLGKGGMIHYAYQLCTGLAEEGAAVTLVTAEEYELGGFPHNFCVEPRLRLWSLFQETAQVGDSHSQVMRIVGKIRWQGRRVVRGARFVWEWVRLARFLLNKRPSVVQFGKINFPFEALFLTWLRRRGLVLTQICHEFELRERDGGLLAAAGNWLYRGVYDNFAALFFHGESNRRRFLELFDVPEARTYLIPHGNEGIFRAAAAGPERAEALRQRYGLAAGEQVVLFFGNLTPSKGLPELLQAFALIPQQRPARLVIAGFPSKYMNMAELQMLVDALGIRDRVFFDSRYVPMKDVGPLMEMATVVVYPYRNSTQSGALQVAYTFGRPVVVTAVGGLPEAVDDGRSGYIVPPKNPQALAEAIGSLLDGPQRAAEMSAYAIHLSETRYAWRPIAVQILAVYGDFSTDERRLTQI